jgi:tetratricopeptide (TPR) repeat protein
MTLLRFTSLRKSVLTALLCLAAASALHARPYGDYELGRILEKNETGQGGRLNVGYINTIMEDLRTHAESYPTHFDTPNDQVRARRDVLQLTGLLEILGQDANAPIDILLRLGVLGHMGYNLEMPRMGDVAKTYFAKALQAQPDHSFANYRMGLFLAQANQLPQALPFLEKAKRLGYKAALYSLGMTYLSLQDTAKALENLNAYQALYPQDQRTAQIIQAIQQGKVSIQNTPAR